MNLCLILAETSLAALKNKLARYAGTCPFLEVRLDYLDRPEVPVLPSSSSTQFIATCRPVREGGRYQGEERPRLRILKEAGQRGFHWIDLEHDAPCPPELPDKVGIIRSYHDFGGFPSDLAGLWARLLALKGTITKLAVQVNRTSELVKLLAWMESLPPSERVILGMGPFGKISRLLGERLGSRWTYVAENAACAAAPGQFGLCEIESLGLPLAADACAELYGVIGNPLVHSLSPPLHNRLFSHYGVNAAYLPLQLSEVDSWFEYLERASLPFRGFSVTLPFKRDVLQHLVSVDSPVTSVNTLVRRGAGWHGLNTDYSGFLQPFRAGSLKGKRALVLGAGGAAHTVVAALQSEGAEVTVAGRDPERLKQFEAAYRCRCVLFSELPESADLCVNTTPVGQFPDTERSPLPPDRLNFGLVYDLIYRPERTRLLKDAQARGIPTISGMQMFVEQAAGQFHAWTGVNPDRALVAELVRSLTETQNGGDAE